MQRRLQRAPQPAPPALRAAAPAPRPAHIPRRAAQLVACATSSRIPFIAARDSISAHSSSPTDHRPPLRRCRCMLPLWLSPAPHSSSQNGKTSAVFEILERYAAFPRKRYGGGRCEFHRTLTLAGRRCFLRRAVCYWNESINWRNSVHTWTWKV